MLFIILATPLALLCFFLAFLAWRRHFRRQAVALLVIGLLFFGLVTFVSAISWYGYFHLNQGQASTGERYFWPLEQLPVPHSNLPPGDAPCAASRREVLGRSVLPGVRLEACRKVAADLGVEFRQREYNEVG